MSKTAFNPDGNLPLDLAYPDSYDFFTAGSSYVEKCPNGFLGPTAYSAIFLEHQGKLDMDTLDPRRSYHKDPEDSRICSITQDIDVPHSASITRKPNRAAIRMGMFILNGLPSQEICVKLMDRYPVFEDIVSHGPTIKYALQSLWDTFGSHFKDPEKPAKLAVVSEQLCRNAWSLLGTELPKNRHEWVASFTGRNFRWELVGVLLAVFGLSAISLPEWDPLFMSQEESRNNRRKFACSMRDLVESCLLLCDHSDNVSDLAVYLLHISTTLQTYCETGKTSEYIDYGIIGDLSLKM